MADYRAGVIAVLGQPNVGKSTIVNAIVGQKVSIVSDKPQTTRRRLMGIATRPEWQMVFVDTPGVHKPHNQLGRILNETARRSVEDVDAVLVVVDASRPPSPDDASIARMLESEGYLGESGKRPVVLCMNKMDLLKAVNVQPNWDAYTAMFKTDTVMLTSFTKKQNIDKLLDILVERLPAGPPLYPEDEVTDQPMRWLAGELIREKALRLTREEVPHALAVLVEEWQEEEDRDLVRISAVFYVERDGQKAILIGKQGAMLKRIGTEARLEIEDLIGKKVFLELFVKVKTDWRENPRILHDLELM